jgi:hypothetical protein
MVPLPFPVASYQLPASLPSDREILGSKTILSAHNSSTVVVGVGPRCVVELGQEVTDIEGQALIFLEQYHNSSLVVPRLYAIYRLASTGHLCLVMQRLSSGTLELVWSELDEVEKSGVRARLKDAIERFLRLGFTAVLRVPDSPIICSRITSTRKRYVDRSALKPTLTRPFLRILKDMVA